MYCNDESEHCPDWKEQGHCEDNPKWMVPNCPYSCEVCDNKRRPTQVRVAPTSLQQLPILRSEQRGVWIVHALFESTMFSPAAVRALVKGFESNVYANPSMRSNVHLVPLDVSAHEADVIQSDLLRAQGLFLLVDNREEYGVLAY